MRSKQRWIRRLFLPRRTFSRTPAKPAYRPSFERLEDRSTPATLTYASATSALSFLADAGESDLVDVTSPSANTVRIQVGNGDAIVLAGDAIANANVVLSTTSNADDTVTITTTGAPIATFLMQLGDQGDLLNFSLESSPNGVGAVTLDGETGDDDIVLGNTSTSGVLQATAEQISFAANATITVSSGDITLTTTDTATTGEDIILASGVSLTALAGGINLFAGDDFKLQSGASLQASGIIEITGDHNDQDAGTGAAIELLGTITAANLSATGNSDADTFTVAPSSLTAISVIGSLPNASPGDSIAFDLTGASDPFMNLSFVSGDTKDGSVSFSNRQSVSFVSFESLPLADVGVTKSDSPNPVLPGGTLTYTVTVTNSSQFGLTGINVTDNLPVSLINPSWTALFVGTGSGGTANGTGNLNETINLASGGTATYTITGSVDLGTTSPISNTATVAVPQGITDSNGTNDSATTNTTLASGSNLKVEVTDSPDPVQVGSNLTYVVTLTNNGPADATAVVLTNTLSNDVNFQSANQSQGAFSVSGNVITWDAGNLANAGTATLTIVVKPKNDGTIINQAAITSLHGDTDLTDNSFQSTTTATPFPSIVAVGAGAGNTPTVKVFDAATGVMKYSFLAYIEGFRGGVSVAVGDINGDGIADIVTGAGPGGGPHVRAFNGIDGTALTGPVASFMAYNPEFHGGVNVAIGDVNDDGVNDVITGAGFGGGPHVIAFSGANASILHSFYAYAQTFNGGVNVAAGDINNDGKDDIITGAGRTGGPHVNVFSGANGTNLRSFYAYDPLFLGGVTVASGDINGDNRDDIITGPGAGGGPHIRAFSGIDNSQLQSFMAMAPNIAGGVSVGVVDADNDGNEDIMVGSGFKGDNRVRFFNGSSVAQISSFLAFDATFLGGLYVGGK
jgi:uncharacterized repeat protein (TIGR01451 family)